MGARPAVGWRGEKLRRNWVYKGASFLSTATLDLFPESAEERSGFTCPETLHVPEAGLP